MSSKCGVCKETINREKIVCYGICNNQFHTKCLGLNTAAIKTLNEFDSIKYVCKECEVMSNKVVLRKMNQLLNCLTVGNDDCGDTIITKIADDVVDIKNAVDGNKDELEKIKKTLKINQCLDIHMRIKLKVQ